MHFRSVLPLFAVAVLVLAVGGSCSSPLFSQPTPTNTPLPPTATATATKVPTNTPTITPDLAATAQAQLEGSIVAQLEDLELPSDTGEVGWVQTAPEVIELSGPEGFYQPFAEDLDVSDFVIQWEQTWETTAWPWCGLYFRSDASYADGDYYAIYFLRFSGLPAWDIEYNRDGLYITTLTTDFKFSNSLDINSGATNQITLAAVGNQFKLYINGHYEGVYYDFSSKLEKGRFAFYAYENSGSTTCTFDNTWVWVYK
jgi:hypothetical protein